jgi:Flp pilus assembly protein TadD
MRTMMMLILAVVVYASPALGDGGGGGSAKAKAPTQAEIAAKLVEEGKEAMMKRDYALATTKFREAVARAPEPQYYVNLCVSLYSEGKFGEANTACRTALQNKPTEAVKQKAEKMIEKIREEARKQGISI